MADPGPGRASLALGTAAVAVVAVGVMALALAPRSDSGMTSAATTVVVIRVSPQVTPRLATSTSDSTSVRGVALAPFAQIPNGVSSAATRDHPQRTAQSLPEPGDTILVVTHDMTYRLHWEVLELLDPPDGAVVLDADGDLIGHFDDSVLVAADSHLVIND